MSADVESMMYFGAVPWHNLGLELKERITPLQALEQGKLDWDVQVCQIETIDQQNLPTHRATRRVQDKKILGVVPRNFVPIQNRTAFAVFDKIVESQPIIETAGALGGGNKVFALAKLPDVIDVKGSGDIVEKYILLVNRFDGRPLEMMFTPVRVVCSNTLQMALGKKDGSPRVAIKPKHSAQMQLRDAQKYMGRAVEYYRRFGDFTDFLATKQMPVEKVKLAIERVFPANEKLEVSDKIEHRRNEVERLFVEGKGHSNPKIAGSAWALINAFAEYADHGMFLEKKKPATADARANSVWFSGARALKQKATTVVSLAVS